MFHKMSKEKSTREDEKKKYRVLLTQQSDNMKHEKYVKFSVSVWSENLSVYCEFNFHSKNTQDSLFNEEVEWNIRKKVENWVQGERFL